MALEQEKKPNRMRVSAYHMAVPGGGSDCGYLGMGQSERLEIIQFFLKPVPLHLIAD